MSSLKYFSCFARRTRSLSLLDGDAEASKAGLASVNAVLKDARRLAKNMPPAKKAAIEKICAEIDELAKELATLQASGQVRVCVVHVGPRVIHIQAALQPLKIEVF